MISAVPDGQPRVLAFVEATTLTGQARVLIDFAARVNGTPPIAEAGCSARVSLATFQRCAACGDEPESPNSLVEAARDAGLTIDVIRERRRWDPSVLSGMRSTVELRRPTVIETHNVKSHFLVRLGHVHKGTAWVAFHEGYTATDGRDRAYNQLNRWSLRAADRVVTMCRPFSDLLARQGVHRERVMILHNAIDVDEAAPRPAEVAAVRRSLALRPGERLVLSVGRLSAEKGHGDLVAAFAALRDRSARLVFVGDGAERGRLEAQRAALGVAERVTFVGQVPEPRGYYGAADVFVLPSHSEGSPVALLEAMAAGSAIVATDVGGVPEIVEDGESAMLAPAHAPGALASALRRVLADADLAGRLGQAARRTASTRFTPERRRDALLGIYREALDARRR